MNIIFYYYYYYSKKKKIERKYFFLSALASKAKTLVNYTQNLHLSSDHLRFFMLQNLCISKSICDKHLNVPSVSQEREE